MDLFYPCEGQLYFAYGLLMHPDALAERNVHAEVLAIGRLANYRVAFFGHSKVWDGGEETVIPDPDGEVWGVLYRLSYRDADRLDAWQDVRLDGSGNYFHYPVVIEGAEKMRYPALIYKKDVCGTPQLPNATYVANIVAAAHVRNLPEAAVQTWTCLDTCKAHYPVPRKGRFDRALLVGALCEGCC